MNAQKDNPLFKLSVWAIALPVFFEFFLTFSVFFTDSFFLSKISDVAASSIGVIIPIFMVFVLILMMMAQGGGNVAGQYLGGGQPDKAHKTFHATLVINGLLGLVACLLFYLFSKPIGIAMGLSGQSLAYVDIYLGYISVAMFLIALKTAYAIVLTSQGKTIWNMYNAVLINAINIVLNASFMYGWFGLPQLGLHGIIIATIISQLFAVLFLTVVVHFKFKVRFDWRNFKATAMPYFKPVLKIGVPSTFEPVSAELGMMVISMMAVSLGIEAMAARTYVMNLLTICICWSASMGIGNMVLVSHRVGAELYTDADKKLRQNLFLAIVGSLLVATLVYLGAHPLLGIFTQDSKIILLGTELMLIAILIEPFRSVSTMSSYALKAAGDAKVPAMLNVAVTWLIAMPSAYIFGFTLGLGLAGVWIGLLIDEALRSLISLWRWRSKAWLNTKVSMT